MEYHQSTSSIRNRTKGRVFSRRRRRAWGPFFVGIIAAFVILAILSLPIAAMMFWGSTSEFISRVLAKCAFSVAAFGGAAVATSTVQTRNRLPGLGIGIILFFLSWYIAGSVTLTGVFLQMFLAVGGAMAGTMTVQTFQRDKKMVFKAGHLPLDHRSKRV